MKRPGRTVIAAAAAVVAAGGSLSAWLLWPSSPAIPGADRVRQYSNARACLLTGAAGLTSSQAAAAWSGMEEASLATRAMVSYQTATGPATGAAALPYLTGLVQVRCQVIVAVGAGPAAAVADAAERFPAVRFVVVGGRAGRRNVASAPSAPPSAEREAIRAEVAAGVQENAGIQSDAVP